MEAAGLDAPPEEIDALFEHFDPENKGSFDYVDPARPARPEPNPVPDPNSIYGRTPLYYNEGEKCVPVYIYAGGTTLDAYKVRVRVRVRVRAPNPHRDVAELLLLVVHLALRLDAPAAQRLEGGEARRGQVGRRATRQHADRLGRVRVRVRVRVRA